MDELFKQVAQIFVDESREQVDRIAQSLLAVERDPQQTAQQMEELYRDAHSLKGSASSLGVQDLETLAHTLEEALTAVRQLREPLTPLLLDAALAAVDAVKERCMGLLADTQQGSEAVAKAVQGLAATMHPAGASTTPKPAPQAATPTPAPAPAPVEEAPGEVGEGFIRVRTSRFNGMEHCVGELRMLQGRLQRRIQTLHTVTASVDEHLHQLRFGEQSGTRNDLAVMLEVRRGLTALRRDLRDDEEILVQNGGAIGADLDAMRLVDVQSLQSVLAQAVREVCRRMEREATLSFEGRGVQIDRRLLEEMKHPLLHLVRNAVAHGIEKPEVRLAQNKSASGRIRVRFASVGSQIQVDVGDDGAGINIERVKERAVTMNLISPSQAAVLQEQDAYELLFHHGFSTEAQVNSISGRGVGLDVVRETVKRMHGQIRVESNPATGTIFSLHLPLSVASCEALILRENGQTFAIPLNNIAAVVRRPLHALREVGHQLFLDHNNALIPTRELGTVLGAPHRARPPSQVLLAVVTSGGASVALMCESVVSIETIVLRPPPPELQSIDILANVAISALGDPFFILPANLLVQSGSERHSQTALQVQRTILVADDSLATRSLLRSTLEASGFVVITAADGEEALRLAQSTPLSLVVSDVSMPRLDGIGLTAQLRASTATASLPIVLFSAFAAPADQERAAQANAYISKEEFDRGALIDVIEKLLEDQH